MSWRRSANPRHEPQIGFDRVRSAKDWFLFDDVERLLYQAGYGFPLQLHIVDKKHTRGLFVGDSFAIKKRSALLEQISVGVGARGCANFVESHPVRNLLFR